MLKPAYTCLNPLNQVYVLNVLWRRYNVKCKESRLNPLNQVYVLNFVVMCKLSV